MLIIRGPCQLFEFGDSAILAVIDMNTKEAKFLLLLFSIKSIKITKKRSLCLDKLDDDCV